MKQLRWNDLTAEGRRDALARPRERSDNELRSDVSAIVDEVCSGGWDALARIAARIDGEVPRAVEVAPLASRARALLPAEQVAAIEFAASRIGQFHQASRPADFSMDTAPGVTVRRVWRPIERVGLYVPGGATPLFSSLMMLAIPAREAGVREIVTATPPSGSEGLDPLIALAADLSGIDRMWTVGGAQAIAALAFGAGPIAKVDKICGPGNRWVAEAKRYVASLPGGPAIDMPAGPSELLVVADHSADARIVAADLLSQAEHDPAAQVLLVSLCPDLIVEVERELAIRLESLPRRSIAAQSLANARAILVGDLDEALDLANRYAPEHLSLAIASPREAVAAIRNAGAIFAGSLAAETFGDYLAGSSHVLPTDGAARMWGGVSVDTFLKAITVQEVTVEGVREIAGRAAVLARMEALEAHALAADVRLEVLA